jgi:hypothetical protein
MKGTYIFGTVLVFGDEGQVLAREEGSDVNLVELSFVVVGGVN